MSYGWCDNEDEHKWEGRDDFERRGPYGYDSEKYHDHWNDCNSAYRDGFDQARRDDERRREEREREEAEEYRQHQRDLEHQREEEMWEDQRFADGEAEAQYNEMMAEQCHAEQQAAYEAELAAQEQSEQADF